MWLPQCPTIGAVSRLPVEWTADGGPVGPAYGKAVYHSRSRPIYRTARAGNPGDETITIFQNADSPARQAGLLDGRVLAPPEIRWGLTSQNRTSGPHGPAHIYRSSCKLRRKQMAGIYSIFDTAK